MTKMMDFNLGVVVMFTVQLHQKTSENRINEDGGFSPEASSF